MCAIWGKPAQGENTHVPHVAILGFIFAPHDPKVILSSRVSTLHVITCSIRAYIVLEYSSTRLQVPGNCTEYETHGRQSSSLLVPHKKDYVRRLYSTRVPGKTVRE